MALFDIVRPRVIELGKIKIGGLGEERQKKDGGTWRLPAKYDHFVITGLHRDAKGDLQQDKTLMDSLKQEHADSDGKLRRIPIALLSNEIEDVLQCAYVAYTGKRVAAKSDGQMITYFAKGGKWLDKPIEEPFTPEKIAVVDGKGNAVFKLHSTFSCVIASKAARWGGVYKLRSTSRITAEQLAGSLVEIKQLLRGVLRGIPLRLAVRPMQVAPNGVVTTVYVVHCELVGDDLLGLQDRAIEIAKHELANVKQINQAQLEYRRLIKAPGDDESESEAGEVSAEFHNDTAIEDAEIVPPIDPLMAQLGIGGKPEEHGDAFEPQFDPESGAPIPQ